MSEVVIGAICCVVYVLGYYFGRKETMRYRYGAGEVSDAVFRVTGAGVQQIAAILKQLEDARK